MCFMENNEKLKKAIKRIEEMNKRSFELSKNYPDKTKRKMFLHYCSAYTSAIMELEDML